MGSPLCQNCPSVDQIFLKGSQMRCTLYSGVAVKPVITHKILHVTFSSNAPVKPAINPLTAVLLKRGSYTPCDLFLESSGDSLLGNAPPLWG